MLRTAGWIGAAMMLAALAGCDDFQNAPPRQPAPAAAPAPGAAAPPSGTATQTPAPTVITPPPPDAVIAAAAAMPSAPASSTAAGQAIEAAAPGVGGRAHARAGVAQPLLVRVQVLLGRAHFSPGAIDGREGSNLKRAVDAWRAAHGLPDGGIDAALLNALTAQDGAPVTRDYEITADDVKGPFLGVVPTDLRALAKLDRVGYATPREALAEKFHMSETLLAALNPGADFGAAGTRLVVVQADAPPLPPVARLEVDKSAEQVRALDAAGKLLAAFPATVGSTERPAPAGEWAVKSVTRNPDYLYDPSRLTWGPRQAGKLTIPPGPNNPVGAVWIALTAETYGIHGAPDPTQVGKTASHGCVRLTNWDAVALSQAISKGAPVDFVGVERRA